MTAHQAILKLKKKMSQSVIGQEHIVERLIIGLLANGNLLVEGLPGLAKTRAVKSLAQNLLAEFSRIQFTPDLLPSDITGSEVYYSKDGKGEFRFEAGPLIANIVLADEINRAPAKVQAALLEAMEERQITVAKKTHKLPELFMVMATQNPIEQEGTYPLPEAQMDRFLMHVLIDYPDTGSEKKIIKLVRGEELNGDKKKGSKKETEEEKIKQDHIFQARKEINEIHVSESIENYIVQLVDCTRYPKKYSEQLAAWLDYGASPRGSLALDKASRVNAWLRERDYVSPDDIRTIIHDTLRHRIILSYEATAQGTIPDDVIDEVIKNVAVA